MIAASEREIAAVAAGGDGDGTSDRISRAAVVDSLREATKSLEPAMADSVLSAALSQLTNADPQGKVSREEVASIWLTNVLPALERVPPRSANGQLTSHSLTERLLRMLNGGVSQVPSKKTMPALLRLLFLPRF